ncbi:MAG: tail fiber domain-containing protein [Bdellovibrionales bacterium]|jgi:prepilin-type N-terminal cleavage/methylation domain-containing protein
MMRIGRLNGKGKRAGFTLIELAIVLAVTSLLTAGLWRMMSSGSTQLRDQAAADQHKELIKAVRGYLASSDGASVLSKAAANTTFALALDGAVDGSVVGATAANFSAFVNFLPAGTGVDTTNSYNQTYQVKVLKDAQPAGTPPDSYSFMIKTFNGDTIPDTSGGRISSMIGGDGGFVYAANVCGANFACGAYGSWSANPTTTYLLATAAGQVASRTFVGMNASLNAPWLARLPVDGDANMSGIGDYNTVQTDISLGGKIMYGGVGTGTVGGTINNLRRLYLEKPAADDASNSAALEVNACRPLAPGSATCKDAVSIIGGVNVDGFLKASSLYAGMFIYDTSDSRKKHDIAPIKNALDKFNELNGYSFVMNGGKETKYGVIAQEVEKVFPEVVSTDDAGYKSVDYMGLIGPLVAAVKELKQENEALKADVALLKKKVGRK